MVRNNKVTVAFARVIALEIQRSRFYRHLGHGNVETYRDTGDRERRIREMGAQLGCRFTA